MSGMENPQTLEERIVRIEECLRECVSREEHESIVEDLERQIERLGNQVDELENRIQRSIDNVESDLERRIDSIEYDVAALERESR